MASEPRITSRELMIKAIAEGSVKRKKGDRDPEEEKKQEPSHSPIDSLLAPEPGGEHFPDDLLENVRSGLSVKVEVLGKEFLEIDDAVDVLSILIKNTELENEKTPETLQMHNKTSRELNGFLYQSPPKPNEDGEVAFYQFSNSTVENLKSGKPVKVKVLMKIFQELGAEGVLNLLDEKTESQAGKGRVAMVRQIPYLVRQKICRLLNVRRPLGNDFRRLAGELGMSNEDIKLISSKNDPAEEVLTWFETKPTATVQTLLEIFKGMKRDDVVDVLSEGNHKSGDGSVLMVRTMAYSVREKICRMLNVPRKSLGGDFRTLAGLLGMLNEDIKLISDKDNPADEILSWWETQNCATVKAFQLNLQEMERHDIVEVLEKAQIDSGYGSDQPHSGIGQEMQSISFPVGPDNEQQLLLFLFQKSLDALVSRGCLKRIDFNIENWRVHFASENCEISDSEANDSREAMRVFNLLKTAMLAATPGYQWLCSS